MSLKVVVDGLRHRCQPWSVLDLMDQRRKYTDVLHPTRTFLFPKEKEKKKSMRLGKERKTRTQARIDLDVVCFDCCVLASDL